MNLFRGTIKVVLGLTLLVVLSLTTVKELAAQGVTTIPLTPRLSLVGDDGSYDKNFYPDGRIWLPTNQGEAREFLLPVFMNNNWYNYYADDNNKKKYIPNPIKSFKFSLLYDSKTIRAVGVETIPPDYLGMDPEDILARKFTFDNSDVKDNWWWNYIDVDHWNATSEKEDGRRFTIAASSFEPLSNSENAKKGRIEYSILLFVRFRIVAELEPGDEPAFISKKPLYIDNREIRYNDMDVTIDRPVVEMSDYDVIESKTDYPAAPVKIITGVTNEGTTYFNTEPYKFGSIAINFFDRLPAFDLSTILLDNPIIDLEDQLGEEYTGQFYLLKPITIDSNAADVSFAEVKVRLQNDVTGTRMMFPTIETDQEWLQFKSDPSGAMDIFDYTTVSKGDIPYIDNGLLGSGNFDPLGDNSAAQGPIYLSVIADPDALKLDNPDDLEKAGEYQGYVSFKAPYAEVNPVRLNVRFDYLRNPIEPSVIKTPGQTGGINLTLFNNNDETVKMIFGTGYRATSGVDALFGEEAYQGALGTTSLDARWYPVDSTTMINDPVLATNGYRDVAPNRYNPRTNSRDIRKYSNDIGTYLYHCKFNNDDYPVVIEWDILDFPAEAQLYLRDTENGKLFPAVNMRNATNIGGTKRSYTFLDARIKEFYIEYTLPHSFNFVNQYGTAAINSGWNLLSLPVRPLNSVYTNVYPNSMNIPYKFTLNQYQDVENGILKVGQGYFVKYSQIKDSIFKGRTIEAIAFNRNEPESDHIKVFPTDKDKETSNIKDELGAWNLVGALSMPTSIEGIEFDPYALGDIAPKVKFTLRFGVWRYEPKEGYVDVQDMLPGYGYWIKTDNLGYYNLKLVHHNKGIVNDITNVIKDNSTLLSINDNAQNHGKLYLSNDVNVPNLTFELPPVPPTSVFDVRFEDNNYLTNSTEKAFRIQGIDFPVSLSIIGADADYTFFDAATGEELGSIAKGTNGNVIVEKLAGAYIRVAKKTVFENNSFSVYPNPVNAVSTVNYTVENESNVTLRLYDAIGNEVMTLVNNEIRSGSQSAYINSANLVTGSYILKLTAGNTNSIIRVNITK